LHYESSRLCHQLAGTWILTTNAKGPIVMKSAVMIQIMTVKTFVASKASEAWHKREERKTKHNILIKHN
jgi:hypothetical protein